VQPVVLALPFASFTQTPADLFVERIQGGRRFRAAGATGSLGGRPVGRRAAGNPAGHSPRGHSGRLKPFRRCPGRRVDFAVARSTRD